MKDARPELNFIEYDILKLVIVFFWFFGSKFLFEDINVADTRRELNSLVRAHEQIDWNAVPSITAADSSVGRATGSGP